MKRRFAALGLAMCMVLSSSGITAFAQQEGSNPKEMANITEASESVNGQQAISLLSSENGAERSILFNEGWKFSLDNPNNAEKKDFDDANWRNLDLPHDWSIEFDFDYGSPATSECGYLNGGTGWYRKTFVLPESMKDKHITIDFGGVYMDSTTYVNGKMMGNYPNGYMPFTYDITDELVCDGKTENVIAVKVVNQIQSSRWYSGSGIYRDVHLTVTDQVHIGNWGTKVTTPELEAGSGKVELVTKVQNDASEAQTVQVRQTILDAEGQAASEAVTSQNVTVAAGETAEVEQTTSVANPALWSTENPNLYYLRTEILDGGQTVDSYETRFGFRYFEFTTDNGFYLNGEWMKLYGVCMHHDQGSLGAVANYTAMERQMRIMKEMGVNAIRVTHNPADDKLLEICDKMGLLVIEEAFDTWNQTKKTYDYGRFFYKPATHPDAEAGQTWSEFDIKNMVDRGKNSPSIIMWSIGNEIWMASSSAGVDIARNLVKWVKEVDDTRLTTIGEDKFRGNKNDVSSNLGNESQVAIFDLVDVPGLNYSENRYDAQHEEKPDWKLYGSEIASATSSRGVYAHPDTTVEGTNSTDVPYQQSSYDTNCVGWGRTAADALRRDRDRKFIAGEFVWTGFDYIGEPTPWNQSTTTPPKSSYFGIVDTAGLPKDSFYLYQSQWTSVEENPMVHILPHWNWEDESLLAKVKDSSGKIPVRVYTNGRSVDLYFKPASDQSEGIGSLVDARKSFNVIQPYQDAEGVRDNQDKEYQETADGKLYLEWRMPYEPGTLTAISYDKEGTEIARDVVVSATEESAVSLKPETNVIQADGSDICYVEVDIKDADGNVVPTAENEVIFNVTGNGRIVGVDNGNAASHERYKDTDGVWKRKAFSGKAVVLVQSTKDAGSFTLTATSDELSSDSVTIFTTEGEVAGAVVLGYNAKAVTAILGESLVLPATVEAVYGDGTVKTLAVSWDSIPEELLEQEGTFQASGTVENGDKIEITVMIVGVLGIRDVTKVTLVGQIPELPDTVELYYTNGNKRSVEVIWNEIDQDQVAETGQFTVEGTIAETSGHKAKAVIRVTDEVSYDRNIATRNGTELYPKPSASFNHVDDYVTNQVNNYSSNFNDGIIDRIPSWNNWNNGLGNAKESWIQLEFTDPETFAKAGIHFYTDNATRKPARLIVQTSMDGIDWTDVSNQDHIDDFGDVAEDWRKEYPVNFDPVTARFIRIYMEGQPSGSNYKPVGVSELFVYAAGEAANETASLNDLKVNGTTIEGFAADQYNYTLEAAYPYEIPEITAEAAEYGNAFVVPAMSFEEATKVHVRAESGNQEKTYTINFEKIPLKLSRVEVLMDNTTVTENTSETIMAAGYLEDNTTIDNALMTTEYEVTSEDGGVAEIVRGRFNAVKAGTVQVVASVTYQGITVASAPLAVTIEESEAAVVITSYEAVKVTAKRGNAPILPKEIMAHVEGSFDRKVEVDWDVIPEEHYADYGVFEVEGTVEGQDLRPVAKVEVKEAVAAAQASAVTPVNVIPELPNTTTLYYSDGTSVTGVPVVWETMNQETFDVADNTIVQVKGTAEADGTEVEVTGQVRVTATDVEKSENYYQLRNGYELPFAVASYTNDNVASTDRVYKLNDGTISFAQDDAQGKNIWCNWVREANRSNDWVGVIMAKEGEVVTKFVDTLSVGFLKEANSAGIQYPTSYRVEYYTGPLDFELPAFNETANPRGNMGTLTEHPFNNPENWNEVTYTDENGGVTDSVPEILTEEMTEITFVPAETCMVRVYMTAASNRAFGITEIEAYGKTPLPNNDYRVEGIQVGEEALGAFREDVMEYTLNLNGAQIPEISAAVTKNASVTVVQANRANLTAKVIVLAENGMPGTQKVYTIHFELDGAVDWGKLEAAIEAAKELDEERYTEESYALLMAAVADAEQLGKDAYQNQVDLAERAIQAAIEALVLKPDKAELANALKEANEVMGEKDQYTPDSIGGLAAAIREAQEVMDDKNASQNVVDAAVTKLNAETAKALRKADKTELTKLTDELDQMDLSSYTPESAAALGNKLTEAKQILANANLSVNDQKQVDDMRTALQAAKDALAAKANKAALTEALAKADQILADASQYTPDSIRGLQPVVDRVQDIWNNENASQAAVDEAVRELDEEIAKAVRKADKADLTEAIAKAEQILADASQYTPDSIRGLEAALADAKKVAEDENASQEAVSQTVSSLHAEAAKALKKADKSKLTELVQSLAGKDFSSYTEASVKALKDALAQAENMLGDQALSVNDQKRVDTMYTVLKSAYDKLEVKKPEPPVPGIQVPEKVTGLQVGSHKTTSVKASWKKADRATKYTVSVYREKTKKWTVAGSTTGTSLVIKKLKPGEKYSVRVVPGNEAGNGSVSATVKTAAKPLKANLKSVKKAGKNGIKVTAKKQDCTKYVLYEKVGNKKFKKVPANKKGVFTRKNRKTGVTYSYRMRAYVKNGGTTVWGSYSKTRKLKLK